MAKRIYKAIGLMSGTSMDGVDAAMIDTDGEKVQGFGTHVFIPFTDDFGNALRNMQGPNPEQKSDYKDVVHELTTLHGNAVNALVKQAGISPSDVDVVGFHGQTVFHDPASGFTCQIGDGQKLADQTGISVVDDFRTADVSAGGQGAPLVPLFHDALCKTLPKPLAVLNIGGVANVTWLGSSGDVLAFDTGPGNALIDDWMISKTGHSHDVGGEMAAKGKVDQDCLDALMDNAYFGLLPPKSLDRNAFNMNVVSALSAEDGAATLTAFTAASLSKAVEFMPEAPLQWLICGGGRKNDTLMRAMQQVLGVDVLPVESVGWQGDFLEAQAFAYLAVRSLEGLPLSLPTTTGVREPVCGGKLWTVST